MSKDYNQMTQEVLENEMVEIIKRNYDKGILLLDHNFSIRTMRELTEISDVVDIDKLICIMRSMKNVPDMRKYFLKDTDKVDFRLIHITDGKAVELLSFPYFSNRQDKIMRMYLIDRLKDHNHEFGEYPIVQMINDKFVGTLAVMFYGKESFIDCAEHEDSVICEKAYGTRDVYLEAANRLVESKYGTKAS